MKFDFYFHCLFGVMLTVLLLSLMKVFTPGLAAVLGMNGGLMVGCFVTAGLPQRANRSAVLQGKLAGWFLGSVIFWGVLAASGNLSVA